MLTEVARGMLHTVQHIRHHTYIDNTYVDSNNMRPGYFPWALAMI